MIIVKSIKTIVPHPNNVYLEIEYINDDNKFVHTYYGCKTVEESQALMRMIRKAGE